MESDSLFYCEVNHDGFTEAGKEEWGKRVEKIVTENMLQTSILEEVSG